MKDVIIEYQDQAGDYLKYQIRQVQEEQKRTKTKNF